ncbi:class F sortase [Phytoactinopolyspora limicola]|uniref:class F sortase n=1 Tax=Phytoactinopolyspora limicola TaxID=2715536 RepID=UPI00140B04E8|nr:class F sortase [Phytoactinopolyspora limicola]
MVLLVCGVLMLVGAAWGVSSVFGGGSSSALKNLPVGVEPVEQGPTPGEPDGTAESRYTLFFPRLGIRAPVVEVASDADRVLEPPVDPLLAGWWAEGAAPGAERGAALVVGHAVEGGEAVFNGVASLRAGDLVVVTGDEVVAHRVTSRVELSPAELAQRADELFDQGGPAQLVLVTCKDWDGDEFAANIVVTAVPL